MPVPPPVPGYRVEGPIGFGADGALWLVRDQRGRARVLRTLAQVSPERHEVRLARLRTLTGVRAPHLAPVLEVIDLGSQQAAVVSAAVAGPSLATVRASRGGLNASETLGVVRQLCAGLAALHGAGVVHGDVAPGNVLIRPGKDGGSEAILVDLTGEWAWQGGTAGFAAPEVLTGSRVGATADIYALARLAMWLAGDDDRTQVRTLLGTALAADPSRRPDISQLQAVLTEAATEPVWLPPASSLAAASLREHAQRDLTRAKSGHRPRHRRRSRAARGRIVIAGAVLLAATVPIGLAYHSGSAEPDQAAAPAVPASEVAQAVHRLTAARDQALSDGDAQALAALSVPQSPVRSHDMSLLQSLQEAGVQLEDLHTEVVEVELLDRGRTRAHARVHLHQQPYRQVHPEGANTAIDAQQSCAVLTLSHRAGWLVADSRPC
ncbi:MAG TPA: protein kinase [Beutenbergiaceae bacterium]|nr:protein kinase [Beutenbergiaceae bacterium]